MVDKHILRMSEMKRVLKSIFIRTYSKIHVIQKICEDCPEDFAQNQRGIPHKLFYEMDFQVSSNKKWTLVRHVVCQ